ncbi:MAG: hypothetical protein WC793_00625 [Candidatus Paceibacterota bacterium]|jgi:hypothetical protein
MKIIDTNILNKFIRDERSFDSSDEFFITEELKDEIEILKSLSPNYRNKIQRIKFIDIQKDSFDEVKYLENYKTFLNKYNNIVSFYGLKGLGDISIMASIATILQTQRTLFDDGYIEVVTADGDLKEALKGEFSDKIIIR